MKDQASESYSRNGSHDFETRVAIDVMFEALSHIQASIDASSEEERVESYRKFKEALYERYEHLLEKRREEASTATNGGEPALETVNGNGHAGNGHADDREIEEGTDSEGGDTLGKLWPAISDKSSTMEM